MSDITEERRRRLCSAISVIENTTLYAVIGRTLKEKGYDSEDFRKVMNSLGVGFFSTPFGVGVGNSMEYVSRSQDKTMTSIQLAIDVIAQEIDNQSNGNWVFERSSGYAGYRCTKCAVWVYENQIKKCNCDKK